MPLNDVRVASAPPSIDMRNDVTASAAQFSSEEVLGCWAGSDGSE